MLGLGPEEIERMYSITKDRLVKKYMEEVKRVNEDPRFREYMTKEEDQKKILNSLITEATAEGDKQSKIEMAKKMLEAGESIEKIVTYTELPREEIEDIKSKKNE